MVLFVHPILRGNFSQPTAIEREEGKNENRNSEEIKREENRVCMTPAGVEVIIATAEAPWSKWRRHRQWFRDAAYIKAGAEIIERPSKDMKERIW